MNEKTITSLKNSSIVILLAVFFIVIGVMISSQFRSSSLSNVGEKKESLISKDRDNVGQGGENGNSGLKSEANNESAEFESPFVLVANRLKPSVVNIRVKKKINKQGGVSPFEELFGFEHPTDLVTSASGIIIDRDGQIITNSSVIKNSEEISVTLSNGDERNAEVIGSDPETDIALLNIGRVDKSFVAKLGDSDDIRIGEWAIAMGNPVGLEWTLTVGIISAKGRSDIFTPGSNSIFQDFIQTDASINAGNSGGPLSNIKGEVIGINTSISFAAQGIGFAIPVNMAKNVVADILELGYVRRGYLGMVPSPLDKLKCEALMLDEDIKGVFVESVAKETPAWDGGLKGSDVISEIDGEQVSGVSDFRMKVANRKPGDRLDVTIFRNGVSEKLNFILADRKDFITVENEEYIVRESRGWMGIDVSSISEDIVDDFDLEVRLGVLVSDIQPDSPAEGKLHPGDLIVKVGKYNIESIEDWQRATGKLGDRDRATLVKFYRGGRGNSRFIALKR